AGDWHVRQECDDSKTCHDRNAGPANTDAAERGVLRSAQDARRTGNSPTLRGRIPRHELETVQLPAHAALHDELVQAMEARVERHRDDRGTVDPEHGWIERILNQPKPKTTSSCRQLAEGPTKRAAFIIGL